MKSLFTIAALLVALSCVVASPMLRSRLFKEPNMSLVEFDRTGVLKGHDMLDQVREHLKAQVKDLVQEQTQQDDSMTEFVELGAQVQKVHNYCEICILLTQLLHANKPQLCKGLAAEQYITCVEILESMIRADKAIVYWMKNGCLHLDTTGPEIVKPCPALPTCSWIPNLFGKPPGIVRDGVTPLCPRTDKFLAEIPSEYKPVAIGGPGAPGGNNPSEGVAPSE